MGALFFDTRRYDCDYRMRNFECLAFFFESDGTGMGRGCHVDPQRANPDDHLGVRLWVNGGQINGGCERLHPTWPALSSQ